MNYCEKLYFNPVYISRFIDLLLFHTLQKDEHDEVTEEDLSSAFKILCELNRYCVMSKIEHIRQHKRAIEALLYAYNKDADKLSPASLLHVNSILEKQGLIKRVSRGNYIIADRILYEYLGNMYIYNHYEQPEGELCVLKI